jgi:hypothetical protein
VAAVCGVGLWRSDQRRPRTSKRPRRSRNRLKGESAIANRSTGPPMANVRAIWRLFPIAVEKDNTNNIVVREAVSRIFSMNSRNFDETL